LVAVLLAVASPASAARLGALGERELMRAMGPWMLGHAREVGQLEAS
jgi:hypothetical protein